MSGPAALAGSAAALLSVVFLFGSTPDEEEFRFAILPSWLHVRALLHGDYGLWTPILGLGIPQPLTPNFWFHPLLPLLAVTGPIAWARIVLVAHTLLGTAGMWQLARTLRLSPLTAAVCVVTFLLASPSQNYALTDFWPSHYVVWTSAPWLLLLTWRVLDAEGPALRRRSVALGLCCGLVVANTNPGHVVVYAAMAAPLAVVHWRGVAARWRWIAVAGLLASAIAGPNLVQILHERQLFAPGLGLSTLRDPLPPAAALTALLRPLEPPEPWRLSDDVRFARTLFFGGPFAVLCLAGCVRFARRHTDLVATVAISALLLFTPVLSLPFVSARYQFRDPLTLAAIPLAGLVADRLIRAHRTRGLAVALLALQLCAIVTGAGPPLRGALQPLARSAMWFRGGTAEAAPVQILLSLMPVPGRLVFSPQVDDNVQRGLLLPAGLGVNALAYRDVPVVNGWFKGISAGSVSPDERMFYARIRVPRPLVESDDGLDVLGIRYVLATADEAVAVGLQRRGSVPTTTGRHLVLYENNDAWPGAFVFDDTLSPAELAVLDDCGNERLLCRDFRPVARRSRAAGVQVTIRDGATDVRLAAADVPRLLVVSQMYRREWIAAAGTRRLDTLPVFGGMIGVRLPPGVSSVRLRYRPLTLELATLLAWCVLLGGLAVLLRSRRAGREAPVRAPSPVDR